MAFVHDVVVSLRCAWQRVYPVFVALDRGLVQFAYMFGVAERDWRKRNARLLGIYAAVYLCALVPLPPAVQLLALLFGFVGVVAVGRAWVANEKHRTRIVKKLENGNPDDLPDLRGGALVSALQLIVLFPLLFRLAGRHGYFEVGDDVHFLTWLCYVFDSYSKAVLNYFHTDLHMGEIKIRSSAASQLILLKNLMVDYILIQGVMRLFAIHTLVSEGVAALKQDPDVALRLGTRAVLPLIDRLHSEDTDLRGKAAEVLGRLRDRRATGPLIAALTDADPEVRWRAAEALAELKDPEAAEPLVTALSDPQESVRAAAAHALAALGDRAPSSRCWRPYRATDRCRCAPRRRTLGKIGAGRAVEPLTAALADADEGVARAAAEALGALKDPLAVEPLMRTFATPRQSPGSDPRPPGRWRRSVTFAQCRRSWKRCATPTRTFARRRLRPSVGSATPAPRIPCWRSCTTRLRTCARRPSAPWPRCARGTAPPLCCPFWTTRASRCATRPPMP